MSSIKKPSTIPYRITATRPRRKFPQQAALWVGVIIFALGFPIAGIWLEEINGAGWEVCANIFIFMLAYWLERTRTNEDAEKNAAEKWVPKAEAVIYRLITLENEVKKMSLKASMTCGHLEKTLPELNQPEFRPVRIQMDADCQSRADKLGFIASGLRDAIRDWLGFVIDNCHGPECRRIQEAIDDRENDCRAEIERLSHELGLH